MQSADDMITIVDPAGTVGRGSAQLAERGLGRGASGPIGILHNSKQNADVLMRHLARMLGEKHGIADVVFAGKNVPGVSVSDEQVESLSHCSVVLTGSGD